MPKNHARSPFAPHPAVAPAIAGEPIRRTSAAPPATSRGPLAWCRIAAVVATTGLLAACGAQPPATAPAADGPLRVVTTTNLVADLASRVGGERVDVVSLMGSGVDPHLYKASEGDLRLLQQAELVLYNGLHLEGKMGDILVKLARSKPVLAVTEAIPAGELREPPELAGQYDPHVWFDVGLWALAVRPIADEIVRLRPAWQAEIEARAAAVEAELRELDAWVAARILELPAERRILVTAHDAFGYFGRRYGMEVVGIQGISTLAEAGLGDVERVVTLVVEKRVPAIFVESSVPRRAVEAVQAAVRAQGHEVVVGGELFSDALGAPGTPAATYPGMVRTNVDTIVGALGGAPR
jgi:manganese/zinc/iron transport system substrate-binding protein